MNLKVYFTVSMHLKCGTHPLDNIPNEILAFIVSINAEIGFDIYCYNENSKIPIKVL